MHPVRQNCFMIGLRFQQCPMQSNQLFHGKRLHPHGFRQSAVGQRFADNCLFIAHRCRQCIDQCFSPLRKAAPYHSEKVLFICNLLRIRRSQLNLNHRRIDIRRRQKAGVYREIPAADVTHADSGSSTGGDSGASSGDLVR